MLCSSLLDRVGKLDRRTSGPLNADLISGEVQVALIGVGPIDQHLHARSRDGVELIASGLAPAGADGVLVQVHNYVADGLRHVPADRLVEGFARSS
jgi:hypothetical protein